MTAKAKDLNAKLLEKDQAESEPKPPAGERPTRRAAKPSRDASPRLELSRRLREIVTSGDLAGMPPSALAVLLYAGVHADFSKATVYLGARTVAGAVGIARNSVKAGIKALVDAGILVVIEENTYTKAATYEITDRVKGLTLRGSSPCPREGQRVDPGRVKPLTPKHASHVSPERNMRSKHHAEGVGVASPRRQAARLAGLRKKGSA